MNVVFKGLKPTGKAHHEYQSVEDQKDLRIPIQNEDAFKHGIVFKAKYIGTQEITRPSNRVEIVSAMRRIRYEYKYRNIKKRKVNVEISMNGIKVTIWKKKKLIQEGKYEESQLFVMCYPINRVFYVSHDSQDLLILSYIARGEDGIFRCSVFKAFKKAQAMGMVRTIGQAFEVCHKLNQSKDPEKESTQEEVKPVEPHDASDNENDLDDMGETDIDDVASPSISQDSSVKGTATVVTDLDKVEEVARPVVPTVPMHLLNGNVGSEKMSSLSLSQLQQMYNQQLNHQAQEVAAAKSEANRLKQQLRIETDSRKDAQSRVEQLLAQNRELLVTVQKLMSQLENVPAKDLFDPVDEKWMITSPSPSDCFLPTRPPTNLKSDITNDCLSSVYDNQYYQSMDIGSSANAPVGPSSTVLAAPSANVPIGPSGMTPIGPSTTIPLGQSSAASSGPSATVSPFLHPGENNLSSRLPSSDNGSFSDLRSEKPSFVKDSKDSINISGTKLSEDVKEGNGGLSTSFNDLTTVGTKSENIDHNHNNGHITKFSAGETDIDDDSEIPHEEDESSVFSREMMETFSQEINELEVLIPAKGKDE